MSVIALDVSTKKIGIAWGEARILDDMRAPATMLLSNPPGGWQRMIARLDEVKWPSEASIIAIEDVYMGLNARTLTTLARLHGALYHYLTLRYPSAAVAWATPAAIDSACGIAGRLKRAERKAATLQFATFLGCPRNITEDEADAVAVWYWAIHYAQGSLRGGGVV